MDDFEAVSTDQTPRKPPRNFPSTENRRRSRSLSRSSFGSLVKGSILIYAYFSPNLRINQACEETFQIK